IVMSPKSLLRHPACVSPIGDLLNRNRFMELIDDSKFSGKKGSIPRKVLYCSGKVYYDLIEQREKGGHSDVAIVRVEQLYPIARGQWADLLVKYKGVPHVWVQEEPENMGAWQFIRNHIAE